MHVGEGGLLDEDDELLAWHRRAAAAEEAQKNAFFAGAASALGKGVNAGEEHSPSNVSTSLENSPMMAPQSRAAGGSL